jgi:hypothetical protein
MIQRSELVQVLHLRRLGKQRSDPLVTIEDTSSRRLQQLQVLPRDQEDRDHVLKPGARLQHRLRPSLHAVSEMLGRTRPDADLSAIGGGGGTPGTPS